MAPVARRGIDALLACIPLLPSCLCLFSISNEHVKRWLLISLGISIGGYFLADSLTMIVAGYTSKAGLHGRDLGKKGTSLEDAIIPEALGLLSGTVFLICTIVSQLMFGDTAEEGVVYNSALFSICFMIFLGFTDDTLDLKWRYKLILPTVASLPLLSAYTGNTAMYIPAGLLRKVFWDEARDVLTPIGWLLNTVVTVDSTARGGIIELGWLFLVFMGLLAVFCTNSINIYAGINGLEAGQSYVIACSILFFKLYELSITAAEPSGTQSGSNTGDLMWLLSGSNISAQRAIDLELRHQHQLFTILLTLPFIAVTLALLKYNWYPAKVFVGDTFCYFSGMTFAVLGIHGHFSKTLLLLFLPQILNFMYSLPQLFKLVPCPRHRLPKVLDASRGLLTVSCFPCKKTELRWLKVTPDAEECPNLTVICLMLRLCGPMTERSLTLVLLALQVSAAVLAFVLRYVLFEIPIR